MNARIFTGGTRLLFAIMGLIVWAVCFVALYVALTLGCAAGWDAPLLNAVLAGVWLAHLAALWWLWLRGRMAGSDGGPAEWFMVRLTAFVTLTGIGATLWIGLPVLILYPCA